MSREFDWAIICGIYKLELNLKSLNFFFPYKAFLGNRYGPRTYKYFIDAEEFDLLKKEVKKVSNKDTARKLEHCYEYEENLQMYKLNFSKVQR